jgi:hypothetical protein
LKKEYVRRLSVENKMQAIVTFAIRILMYSFGIIYVYPEEIEDVERR